MEHKQRYSFCIDEVGVYWYICDNTKNDDDKIIFEFEDRLDAKEVCEILNKQDEEIQQLKQELRYIQSKLHNATLDVRARTLKEVSDAIEKMKRYE